MFQCFRDAIKAAVAYKNNSTDFMDEIMRELEVGEITLHHLEFRPGEKVCCFWLPGLAQEVKIKKCAPAPCCSDIVECADYARF